ncbi:MAG: glutathione S-transferase N-terminal domain-containing protein [Pseudomonadota bacterium]|nr:glutathione S-transferase N-terminal domain-containing protein [Pseudomonadota bacterium]
MKIYGNPFSTCTRKVLATFAEKGHTPDLVVIDLAKGEHKSPEHVARQPFGQVPALEEDGWRLYESRAIIRYLDTVLSGPALIPSDARGVARMEQWISVESANFTPGAMKIIYQTVFGRWRGQTPDMDKVSEGRAQLIRALDVMDRALAESEFIAGDQYTLADICFLPYLEYLEAGDEGDTLATRANVSRWWTAARARPAWQKAIGK